MQINQLEADLAEVGSLLEKAERKRVQDLLIQEQKKVEKELSFKRQQKEQLARKEADPVAASKATYTVKITNYGRVYLFCFYRTLYTHRRLYVFFSFTAWDQSDKFVKIYLTLKDVHKIPSENVEVTFEER